MKRVLSEVIEEAIDNARLEGYEEGYRQGKFDAVMEQTHGKVSYGEKAAQEIRDEIVEQAKNDVTSRVSDGLVEFNFLVNTSGDFSRRTMVFRLEFYVNKNKRAVTCLLRRKASGIVHRKGIAKCAPDDCFNVHVGKAIALRRALGLDVPSEYYNAPQPTDANEGDIIKWLIGDYVYRLLNNRLSSFRNIETGEILNVSPYSYLTNGRNITIIDDSRDEVSE